MLTLRKLITVLLFILPSSVLFAAVEMTQSEMLAKQCAACHGMVGEGAGKIPELRGLEKSDIVESMEGFKTGEEKSTIMDRYAKALSDKEIQLLAEYYSKLK